MLFAVVQLQQLEAEEEGEAEGVAEAAAEADCQPASLLPLCMARLNFRTMPWWCKAAPAHAVHDASSFVHLKRGIVYCCVCCFVRGLNFCCLDSFV